ncbi:TVP38/TMEM64 family protein [Companilactobacillus mishanensis]|uniref:TVP38/TMEM64 family membrane protein n=1 Tax=Companilactobacillus mishanensis TaxID=2486008 RepID=A0ABW9P536_9LACO|nr:VTT domain-containing protein [Companilactobacillus mishanensis]MQS44361.1 VTT domain-containing protein [Companilactobacillus mishanensis]
MSSSKKIRIVIAIFAFTLLVIICIRQYSNIAIAIHSFNRLDFLKQIRDQTPLDAFLLILLLAGFSIIPGVPVSVIAVLTGVIFGNFLGAVINVVGVTLGNLTAQKIFQYFHEKVDIKKSPKLISEINKMKYPMLGIAVGYMIPFIPTSLVSLAVTDIKLNRRFILIATVLGGIPMSIIYSFGGNAIIESHFKLLIILILIVVVLVYAAIRINKIRIENS